MEETRKIVLFEEEEKKVDLLPLSFTRPVSAFRVGILTIEEKWRRMFAGDYCIRPVEYLRGKFCGCTHDGHDVWHIAGNVLPDRRLVGQVESLQPGESLVDQAGRLVAFRGTSADFGKGMTGASRRVEGVASLQYVFDVFLNNGEQIKADYRRDVDVGPARTARTLREGESQDGDEGVRRMHVRSLLQGWRRS